MHHAGDGAGRTGAHIGRGTGDGTRGRDAAEERHDDVGDALCHQLLIRIVLVVDHAIRHCGREQRFDRAQQCDGEGRHDEVTQFCD